MQALPRPARRPRPTPPRLNLGFALQVRDKLVAACLARGVTFRYNASVEGLRQLLPRHGDDHAAGAGDHAADLRPSSSEPAADPAAASTVGRDPAAATAARQPEAEAEAGVAPGEEGSTSGRAASEGRPARGKRRHGSSRSSSQLSGVKAAPPAPTQWLCRLQDGSEHVTDKLVGAWDWRSGGPGRCEGACVLFTRHTHEVGAALAARRARVFLLADGVWIHLAPARRGGGNPRGPIGSMPSRGTQIIATGGLSFPAVGTDGTGLRILRSLGHSLHETYPALTPLTGAHPNDEQLAGDG